jgi:hypothetical protein
MSSFAVDDHSSVFRQIAQEVRLYLVFLLFGIITRRTAACVAPRLFDYALPAEEIGALDGPFFIGSFEDEPVAQIESEDARFFTTERRDE